MYTTNDIYPVSDFNRKPAEHIKRLKETKKPEVLTVNGKAAVVMVDPESYDQLIADKEMLETLKTIAIANEQHASGLKKPAKQVSDELKAELKEQFSDDL